MNKTISDVRIPFQKFIEETHKKQVLFSGYSISGTIYMSHGCLTRRSRISRKNPNQKLGSLHGEKFFQAWGKREE
jgi:hypothetical protein